MTAYYNENQPYAAAWLRSLIAARLIPDGRVDERSIADVLPEDLDAFIQVHLFAGLGGWPLALRLAAWPDRRPILTGSCPCQPFSVAGKGLGSADARHLWPHMFRLVRALRPPVIMGEQVAGAAGYGWLDGVHADLASENYTCEAADIPAGSVNAPHIRNRIYWLAHPDQRGEGIADHDARELHSTRGCDSDERLAESLRQCLDGLWPPRRGPEGRDGPRPAGPLPGWLGDPGGARPPLPEPEDLPGTRRWEEGGAAPESGSASGGLADPEDGGRRVLRQPPECDGLPDRSHANPWGAWTLVGPDPSGKYRRVGLERVAHPASGSGQPGRPQRDEQQLQDGDRERHQGDGGGHQGLGESECPFRRVAHERLPGGDGLRPIDLLSKGQVQRVNKLRCLGNGLVIELAAEVIRAYMETHQ